jgi:hypothetical protein
VVSIGGATTPVAKAKPQPAPEVATPVAAAADDAGEEE